MLKRCRYVYTLCFCLAQRPKRRARKVGANVGKYSENTTRKTAECKKAPEGLNKLSLNNRRPLAMFRFFCASLLVNTMENRNRRLTGWAGLGVAEGCTKKREASYLHSLTPQHKFRAGQVSITMQRLPVEYM